MSKTKKVDKPTLIRFMTGWAGDKIERVEILRETKQCVYLPRNATLGNKKEERREAKRGEFVQYHETWADAHAYLLERAEAKVDAARLSLERAKGHLGNIKGMKPPKQQ